MHTRVCQLQVDLDHLDSLDLVTHWGLISKGQCRGGDTVLKKSVNIHSHWAVDLTCLSVNGPLEEG